MALAIENAWKNSGGNTGSNAVVISTAGPNELLVAFHGNGTSNTSGSGAVTGGGLTWHDLTPANSANTGAAGQVGYSQISWAFSSGQLTSQTITGTHSTSTGWILVVAFTGALSTIGTSGVAGGLTGTSASKSITTTANNSWVWGCVFDEAVITPAVGGSQTLKDSFAGGAETAYTQYNTLTTPSSGTSVTLNSTIGSGNNWNEAVIEILDGGVGDTVTAGQNFSIRIS